MLATTLTPRTTGTVTGGLRPGSARQSPALAQRWSFNDDAAVLSCGPFVLIDALATGGMGEVWLAAPQGLAGAPDLCVLKRIKSELSDNDGAVVRFVDESRLGLLLRHPCISRTIDAGRADGSDYLAAELVEGIDLAVLLGRATKANRDIPPVLSWWMMAMALDGLDYAHNAVHPLTGAALGVVHRDISPANLMATSDGVVRVIDFGLALSSVREAQTEMGLVLGKLGYMSPEQARGEPVDGACDVFATGVVLYELLVGKRHYHSIARENLATVIGAGLFRAAHADRVDELTGGLYSAMVDPDPRRRPTAAQARDVLLARVTDADGVDEAARQLGALIRDVAAPELGRVAQAREKSRQLPPTLVEHASTTISIAVSESLAVQALLNSTPPPITREVSPLSLAPGQMWQASPSLIERGMGAAAPTISLPTPPAPPMATLPWPTPPVAQQPTETSTTTATTATTSSRPHLPWRGIAVGAVATAIVAVMWLRGPDQHAVHAPSPVAPATTEAASTPTPTTTAEAAATPTASPATPILEPAWAVLDTSAAATPSTTTPAPASNVARQNQPTRARPPPQTSSPKRGTTPVSPPPAAAAADPLLDRVRRLAQCDHACAGVFIVPARQGVAGYSAEKRRALEAIATNCERVCR